MYGLYYIAGSKKTNLPPMRHMKMPLFSDNSRVYQKIGMFSVGVGSVANMRVKGRRI